jgi:hypothetical protein
LGLCGGGLQTKAANKNKGINPRYNKNCRFTAGEVKWFHAIEVYELKKQMFQISNITPQNLLKQLQNNMHLLFGSYFR